MPVIINSQEIHPFLPSLGSPLAIDRSRAERQDWLAHMINAKFSPAEIRQLVSTMALLERLR